MSPSAGCISAARRRAYAKEETHISDIANAFLNALPSELKNEVLSFAKLVTLPANKQLFAAGEKPRNVHFIESGLASTVTLFQGGAGVETGLTGVDSFPEKIHLLGPHLNHSNCFMQIAGSAYQAPLTRFRVCVRTNALLQELLMLHCQADWITLQQLSGCNRLHTIEERLARWLLTVADYIGSEIKLTQDFLAYMLGCRRSSVTLAAGSLQQAGLIRYRHGQITICDLELLEDSACECYRICARYRKNLQGDSNRV